jgi:hypothetical protein
MYGVSEEVQGHPSRYHVQTQIPSHCQQAEHDQQSDATADGKDFKNAQTAAR